MAVPCWERCWQDTCCGTSPKLMQRDGWSRLSWLRFGGSRGTQVENNFEERHCGGNFQGRAVPLLERTGGGRIDLSRHSGSRSGTPNGATPARTDHHRPIYRAIDRPLCRGGKYVSTPHRSLRAPLLHWPSL